MYSPREREQRRIVDQRCEKLRHDLRVLEQEVDKCRRLFYDLQASWEKEVQRQKNERRRRAAVVIIQNYVRKWLVRRAYLRFLSVTTSIQCCWRKVLAIREFRRLKQEATGVTTNHIQDSRANLLEEGGNDTVQPCDTTQVRSDLDFGVKSATVQVTETVIILNPTVGSS
jgi:myosin heavy subunit